MERIQQLPEAAPSILATDVRVMSSPVTLSPTEEENPKKGPKLHKEPPVSDIRRALPASVDAEKGVLASMMLDPIDAINAGLEKLRAGHFSHPAHRLLFEALSAMKNKGQPIDAITLQQYLYDRNEMDKIGGPATIGELLDFVPTAAHIDYYAEIVLEKFTLRSLIDVCTRMTQRSYDEQQDVPGLLDDAEREVLAIKDSQQQNKDIRLMKDYVVEQITLLEKLSEDPDAMKGLPTGFADLDKLTNGLHGSEMIIIAARPSMGKTSLVMNMVEYAAVDCGKPAAVFSLEMSAGQLVQRLISSRARISLANLRTGGFLRNGDFPRLTHVAAELASAPIYIDDTPAISIGEFKAKARRLKKQYDIQLIAIDYLQLMKSTSKRATENRQIEIAEISSGLKAVAKELNVPIIVLAQLNRGPESRDGGRPRLSDLRESGSIEQDADVVGLLVREQYYAEDEEAKAEAEGLAKLIIAKNRNGATDDVLLTFLKEFTRFESRAPDFAQIPG